MSNETHKNLLVKPNNYTLGADASEEASPLHISSYTSKQSFKELKNDVNIGLVLNYISGSHFNVKIIGQLVKITNNFIKNRKTRSSRLPFNSSESVYHSNQAKTNLRDIVKGYFSKPYTKFITLTFAPNKKINKGRNLFDPSYTHPCVKLFIRKLQKMYPDFKYVCVAERHKSGQIHYHMLAQIPYLEKEKVQKMFPYGATRIDSVKNNSEMGKYLTKISYEMSKYLSKDNSNTFKGHKRYFCSKSIRRIKLSDYDKQNFIKKTFMTLKFIETGSYRYLNSFNEGICYWFITSEEINIKNYET